MCDGNAERLVRQYWIPNGRERYATEWGGDSKAKAEIMIEDRKGV